MKKYLVITIDVEPDCSPNWSYSSPLAFRGVSEGISQILQPLFNRYGMQPTYLLNNVVIEDDASCEVLRTLDGKYELGTHLHPEFIEPQKTEFDYAGKRGAANCCFYPPDIEFEKLKNITTLFTERFGYAPQSFRAGRFSAGKNTITSLTKLGYKVDTSVTPHVNWNDASREGPVNYIGTPEQPYTIKENGYPHPGQGEMLEVPVTISLRRTHMLKELKKTYFGLRQPYKTKRPVWLRPVYSKKRQFMSVVEEHEKKYAANDILVFNMMFHNVEVMPGLSPYTRTQQQCDIYLEHLESFFQFCNDRNIVGATLKKVSSLYKKLVAWIVWVAANFHLEVSENLVYA